MSARHDGLVHAGTGPEHDAQAGTRTRTRASTRTSTRAGPADDGQPGTGTLDDATMVARARDGDVHAFEVLVRRYQRPIYRLAFRMLSTRVRP
ncbi:MAG: hypothetical protein ABSF03_11295 [Streptosporangiaceae bacterium]